MNNTQSLQPTEREFLVRLRRVLLSAVDLIDCRLGLGKYAGIVVQVTERQPAESRAIAPGQEKS